MKNLHASIRTKCERVSKINIDLIFSISIDAAKVPQSLNINAARKCVMGGSCPNHMISTQHLGKDCIRKILDNASDDKHQAIELASEVKIAVISFQNLSKTLSPMSIIAARPQGNNETSSFTSDACEAARLVEQDIDNVSFVNFATDGVLVETHDAFLTLCECLDGKKDHCAAINNKHNIKNNRYQHIGGSNPAVIGNYCIDCNLLLMANVSSELIAPKDFASDKKVE